MSSWELECATALGITVAGALGTATVVGFRGIWHTCEECELWMFRRAGTPQVTKRLRRAGWLAACLLALLVSVLAFGAVRAVTMRALASGVAVEVSEYRNEGEST